MIFGACTINKPSKALHRRGNPFSGPPFSGLTSKGKRYYQVKTENTRQLENAAFQDGLAREPENRIKQLKMEDITGYTGEEFKTLGVEQLLGLIHSKDRNRFFQNFRMHPGQKAIIVSGFADTSKVKTAQKIGAGGYLKKPLTLEILGAAVKKALFD